MVHCCLVRVQVKSERGSFVDQGSELHTVSLDENTGSIVVCVGTAIHFYDTNGFPLAVTNVAHVEEIRTPTSISSCCVVGDG